MSAGIDRKVVHERLSSLIWRCLDNDLVKTAHFYAERLFAFDGSNHEARHLLATATLRLNQPHSALHLVTRPRDDQCAGCYEIAAKCSSALGRHSKARNLLEYSIVLSTTSPIKPRTTRVASTVPDAASLHCHSGILAAKACLTSEAITSFTRALQLEPLLWEAWTGLCVLGAKIDVDTHLPIPPHLRDVPGIFLEESSTSGVSGTSLRTSDQTPPLSGPRATGLGFFTPDAAGPSTRSRAQQQNNRPMFGPKGTLARKAQQESMDESTPTTAVRASFFNLHVSRKGEFEDDERASKRQRVGSSAAAGLKMNPDSSVVPNPVPVVRKPAARATATATFTASTRRSTRLQQGIVKPQIKYPPSSAVNRKDRHHSQSSEPTTDSGSNSQSPLPNSPFYDVDKAPILAFVSEQEQKQAGGVLVDRYILDMVRMFARAHLQMSRFECKEMIATLEKLPPQQQLSPTVMILIGRGYFEMVEYPTAERAYKTARSLDPYRIWDLDHYSSLLWHLKRSSALAGLAQEMLNIDPKAPEAWIAVGNCFSLQREHHQAMTAFQRAYQLDEACFYAYALQGHEALAADEVRKAMSCFQTSIRINPRGVTALYGLGVCFLRSGRLQFARMHLEKAVDVHPRNAVILKSLGEVYERLKDPDYALELYDRTLALQPNSAMCLYRRAKLFHTQGKYQAATDDLERAMKIEPNEPNTVLLMGQVYKAMGKLAQAVQMMTIARDLDPKNAQKINRMIEAFKAESSKASSTSVFGGTGGYRGGAAGTAVGTGGTTRGGPAAGNQNPNPVQNRGGMLAGAGGYAGGPGYGYGYAAASGSASQSFEANGSADISMDSS